MTSPHKSMPVLFGCGRVGNVSYNNSSDLIASLWAFNDGEVTDLD